MRRKPEHTTRLTAHHTNRMHTQIKPSQLSPVACLQGGDQVPSQDSANARTCPTNIESRGGGILSKPGKEGA